MDSRRILALQRSYLIELAQFCLVGAPAGLSSSLLWCPRRVKTRWLTRSTQIVPVEGSSCAGNFCADRIRGADILLLIDSEAVEPALIKGYSSKEDLCHIIFFSGSSFSAAS